MADTEILQGMASALAKSPAGQQALVRLRDIADDPVLDAGNMERFCALYREMQGGPLAGTARDIIQEYCPVVSYRKL